MTPIKYLLTSVAFAFVPLYYTAATKGEAIDAQVKRRQAIEQFQEAVNVMTAGFDTDGDGRVTRKDADGKLLKGKQAIDAGFALYNHTRAIWDEENPKYTPKNLECPTTGP